jgi:hypothetical protein
MRRRRRSILRYTSAQCRAINPLPADINIDDAPRVANIIERIAV